MNDFDDINSIPTMKGSSEDGVQSKELNGSAEYGVQSKESKDSSELGARSSEVKDDRPIKSLSGYDTNGGVTGYIGERVRAERGIQVGDTLMDRYVVGGELGRGGMGVVYKCLDKLGRIEVALKVLPPELSHNEGAMEDVRDNFALVEKLTHSNIANVKQIELDKQSKNYYLIMELVQGETLKSLMRRRRKDRKEITLNEIVPILKQVANALDYAHSKGVLHRDVKPENIMIESDGNVKLLDFGLAYQIRSSMSRVTMVSQNVSGTAPYMSPEQWRAKKQGPASDQYALGVIAYELLAGELPFDSSDIAVLREAVVNEEVDPIEGVDKNVQAAISKALSKKATDRFASCSEFIEALAGKGSSELGVRSSEIEEERLAAEEKARNELHPKTFVINGVEFEMMPIKAGSFMMGSPVNRFDEKQHRVTLTKDFYMGKYEVTQEQWKAIMGNNPSRFKGARRPVECVSWDDAHDFIRKLNTHDVIKRSGMKFRLPTEAEWEYSCRSGTTTQFSFGDKASLADMNYSGSETKSNSSGSTKDVGSYAPNAWGLYDMHGNVYEWCEDMYGDYSNNAVTDPKGAYDGVLPVVRGGAWKFPDGVCGSASRFQSSTTIRFDIYGFRLVCVEE